MIERHIDYLSLSVHLPETVCRDDNFEIIRPIANYKRGYKDDKQIRYYYGNPNSKKCYIVLSGEVLHALRCDGYVDAEIVEKYISLGARVSRIDIAVTEFVDDTILQVDTVAEWFRSGRVNSSWVAGGCKMIVDVPKDDLNSCQTVYIGSMADRGKKGIFRAYDKGFEMNLDEHIITRLEVEDRGDKAHVSARRLADGASVASVFRTRFDVQDDDFERLMQAPVADISRGRNFEKRDAIDARNKRWHWLINQVAPSIKQAMADDKRLELDDAMLSRFLSAAGLSELMRDTANDLAYRMYRDTLEKNTKLYGKFSE
jgi:DNA relaxase NicK